jgi:lysine N6-hydroxylase
MVHDFVAVGLGPFNLGLACLAQPLDIDGVFLEARPEFDWHPGMLLADSTLQVPFLADLVTLADPTSPYSFLSYLKDQGRIYPFYIRESFYPLRVEYNDYCRWVTRRLPGLHFDRAVEQVTHADGVYVVTSRSARTGETFTHRARRLVVGVGTPPHVPGGLRDLSGPVLHSSEYLAHRARLRRLDSITVVGSGQSAAEIYHDLLQDIDEVGYALDWVTRSPRFFPLEYTRLTLELTSPEYSRHFSSLGMHQRDALLATQGSLYKGISGDLVDAIYDTLYTKQFRPGVRTRLLPATTVLSAHYDGDRYALRVRNDDTGVEHEHETAGLVLATGYRARFPRFLEPVRDRIRWDARGRPDVHPHYAVDHAGEEIFVQNAEEHTHGFVAPDLGMGAHRNSVILARMLGWTPYPVEERVAFQEFGTPVAAVATAGRA